MRKFFYNKEGESLFSIEIAKGGYKSLGFYYELGGYNDDKTIYLGLIFLKIWISWGLIFKEKKYGLEITNDRVSIWYGKNDYFQEGEGNKIIIFWLYKITDFFFGKELRLWGDEKYFGKYELIMDYGDRYIVKITGQQLYKWRSRLWGRKGWYSFELTPDRIIPYQGKGENSWDCGDSGTTNLTTGKAKTPEEALKILKDSCEKSRLKYGLTSNIQMDLDNKNKICEKIL